ncbi:MAG TPA: SPOR domain-containing protein, partial [Nevskiaceae bacterium]
GIPRSLYVYAGGERLALQPGEYFLRHAAGTSVVDLCVAAGGVTWQAIGSTRGGAVTGGKCMTTRPSGLAESAFTADLRQSLSSGWALPALAPTALGPTLAAADAGRMVASAGGVQVREEKPTASRNQPSAIGIPAARERARAAELHRELAAAAAQTEVAARRPAAAEARSPEAAAAATDAKARSDSGWAINVASSPEQDDARRQRQRLADAGYDAVVVPAQVDGQTWYRVQLTGFGSRDEALAQVASLESRFAPGRQLWVVRSR